MEELVAFALKLAENARKGLAEERQRELRAEAEKAKKQTVESGATASR